jgi:undecaprenyl pyrophosphate phosphatase UppP
MSFIHIVILSVIQGLAELLPVSSSAHVIAAAKILHEDPSSPRFTWMLVMLHTGTMFAVILYFWRAWMRTFFHSENEFLRFSTKIIIATGLTGMIGYGIKTAIEKSMDPGFTALVSDGLVLRGPHALPTPATALTSIANVNTPTLHIFRVDQTLTFTASKGGEDIPYKTFKVTANSTVADLMEFFRKSLAITPSTGTVKNGTMPTGVQLQPDPETPGAMVIEIVGNPGSVNKLKLSDTALVDQNQEPSFQFSDFNKAEIEQLFKRLDLLAYALAAAGLLILIAGIATRFQRQAPRKGITTGDSVAIGAVQGLCLPFRGFSRSGATISVGLLRGVARMRVEEFSFALAVVLTPVAVGYEALRLVKHHGVKLHDFVPGLEGMGISFLAGLVALKFLSKLLEKGQWWLFGIYCFAAAAAVYWMHLHDARFGG